MNHAHNLTALSLTAAFFLTAAMSGCNLPSSDPNTNPTPEIPRFMPGELFVELEDGVTTDQLDSLLESLDIERRATFFPEAILLMVPEGDEEDRVASLEEEAIIRAAHLNRFGHEYALVESEDSPSLQGDSLHVWVAYSGCGPDNEFSFEYAKTGASAYEVWLYKQQHAGECAAVFEERRAFYVPEEIRNAPSVRFIKPVNQRIELKD